MEKKFVFYRGPFISWFCAINDCGFCSFSTHKNNKREISRRNPVSIYAELIAAKELGWGHGFLSGGIGSYNKEDLVELCRTASRILGQKVWLNIGPLHESFLDALQPYVEGVVGAIETIRKDIHKEICPSKPVESFLKMYNAAEKRGMKKGMTFLVGVGEEKSDYDKLKEFLKENDIDRLYCYSLVTIKGTKLENRKMPKAEYHAWWIEQVRKDFPYIEIIAGIWEDRVENVGELIDAGADGFCRYPALRQFGSEVSKKIEQECIDHGKPLQGSLTEIPTVDWDKIVESHGFKGKKKEEIKKRIKAYFRRPLFNLASSEA